MIPETIEEQKRRQARERFEALGEPQRQRDHQVEMEHPEAANRSDLVHQKQEGAKATANDRAVLAQQKHEAKMAEIAARQEATLEAIATRFTTQAFLVQQRHEATMEAICLRHDAQMIRVGARRKATTWATIVRALGKL